MAWGLGLAFVGEHYGLTAEVGAFIAGIALAASPISLFISERLKPLRDFFLILFFFSVGASFNLDFFLANTLFPSLLLALILLAAKPVVFGLLLQRVSETKQVAWELGVRLGQISEFSLLIAHLAGTYAIIGLSAENLIEATAIVSCVVSSYLTVLK